MIGTLISGATKLLGLGGGEASGSSGGLLSGIGGIANTLTGGLLGKAADGLGVGKLFGH